MKFTVDLNTLNGGAPFGSDASGTATLTLDAPSPNIRTLRVQVDASGLEDVSTFGGIHVAHIHGQFAGNASRPLLEQGDGSFFDGTGGIATNSVLPTLDSSDIDGDGFLNFLEGRPSYGPVVLNLTTEQVEAAPEGTPPLTHFLNLVGAGELNPAELFPSGTEFTLDTTYTFDLSDPDQLRQFSNLTPLVDREIVIHGLTIPTEISEAIDAAAMGNAPAGIDLGNGESFRITAPVAAGTIEAVPFEGRLDQDLIGTAFNPAQYLASYDDLINAFGFDLNAANTHYNQFGIAEGRPRDLFDEVRYLASYNDLIDAFGLDFQAATEHYIRFGAAENRPKALFDPVTYLNNYSDLQIAFGDDVFAAAQHYIQFGADEGRVYT